MNHTSDLDPILAALRKHGLVKADETPQFTRLTGGVSSDIWRVDLSSGSICVKRALAKLKVVAEWQVPVSRNAAEAAWLRCVAGWLPHAVPKLLFDDAELGCFAMAYLPPDSYPVWKTNLLTGHIDGLFAEQVGAALATIHRRSAYSAMIAVQFANHATFESIRIAPYLRETARRHPDLASTLCNLADTTTDLRTAVVHGDVSPKNILCGHNGPVFLDAECATYGDPAFDLAFCLTHLVLKSFLNPQWLSLYMESFDRLSARYLVGVDWEVAEHLDQRCARLLPGLLLARIDGKSPVEYIDDPDIKDSVRALARALLVAPVNTLAALQEHWSGVAFIITGANRAAEA